MSSRAGVSDLRSSHDRLSTRGRPGQEASWLERYFGASDAKLFREGIPDVRFWFAFGAGRLSDAYDAAMEYGRVRPVEASYVYFYAAICALWERDGERTAAALAALDATGVHGRVVDMDRRTIRAGLAALEGRAGDALSAFREALAGWRDLGSPWREALTAITMATLLEPAAPRSVPPRRPPARSPSGSAAPFIARLTRPRLVQWTGPAIPPRPRWCRHAVRDDTIAGHVSLGPLSTVLLRTAVPAFQAACRGFEPRLPLHFSVSCSERHDNCTVGTPINRRCSTNPMPQR